MTPDRLDGDLAEAMRAGRSDRVAVLRLILAAAKNEAIKCGHELTGEELMAVINRQAKQRRDSIAAYQAAGRSELAAAEEAELAIITEYLPQAMDRAELEGLVDTAIAEVGSDKSQTGRIIGAVMQRAGASADGSAVAELVRTRLG